MQIGCDFQAHIFMCLYYFIMSSNRFGLNLKFLSLCMLKKKFYNPTFTTDKLQPLKDYMYRVIDSQGLYTFLKKQNVVNVWLPKL